MKKINIKEWKRKSTYENFIQYSNPTFSIGTRLDVTELVGFCKKNKRSFFTTFLYIAIACINEIEEMHTRIVGEDVVIFERIKPSYIVLLENGELVTCNSAAPENYEEFYAVIKGDINRALQENTPAFNEKKVLDCVYVSCLPWLDFTSVANPYHYEDKESTSIPRITWGKFTENTAGRLEMAMDIAAHHALIDGMQVSKIYEKIQTACLHPEEFLGGQDER